MKAATPLVVASPDRVRYAFRNSHAAGLFNPEGLSAAAVRTATQ